MFFICLFAVIANVNVFGWIFEDGKGLWLDDQLIVSEFHALFLLAFLLLGQLHSIVTYESACSHLECWFTVLSSSHAWLLFSFSCEIALCKFSP